MRMSPRLFAALLAVTLAFRWWLAAVTPITGDEAYFIWWGWRPDWGFYDHPPMIGWWLYALSRVSDTEAWLRLPVIIQPAILALSVIAALRRLVPALDGEQRYSIGTLVLLAPANVWNVFITTDTPLVYFSVLSGLAWLRAAQDESRGSRGLGGPWRWYLAAGVLLAGAVLSKYFAALLGFAYLIDVLRRRTRHAWTGLIIAYAATLPVLALMAWWNAGHCWPNYMFNFINRHTHETQLSLTTPLLYLASLLYLLTPPALWLAWRESSILSFRRTTNASALRSDGSLSTFGTLAWIPLALFAALSLVKQVGLHWLLAFIPFTLIWIALRLRAATLRRLCLFFIGFAALHVGAIFAISRLPLETWNKTRIYDGLVLTFEHEAILKELAPYTKDWVLAMDGYSNAVTMGYNARRYFIVFGEASSHARHDDILTDFRPLAGRNMLVLRKSEPDLADYRPYFRHVSVDSFVVRGARFWRVKGEGFNYPAYRDGVLASVKRKYYAIPQWLPQTACYFCDRYFPGERCQR